MNKLITFFLLLGLISCTEHADKKAEGEKLMEISRNRSNLLATGDIEGSLKYWTDDAVLILPKQPPFKGKEALRSMFQNSFQMPGFKISWEPQSVSVAECGDMAYMIERSLASINDSLGQPIIEYHRSVTIWVKEPDRKWRNSLDIWTKEPVNE